MRVMHLSDLHLGKSILEQSLIEDQEYILNKIMEKIKENNVDIVLIAGDVYDKGVPNVDAVKLFNVFLGNLYNLGIKVFVISGNHDSKDRLAFGNELFVQANVYIEVFFRGNLRKVQLKDQYGKLNIYMLPFVKPADIRPYFSNYNIDSYNDAIRCIINSIKLNKKERNIIMLHQFVTSDGNNLVRCESESISLGGIDNVDISLFDDFDYVAMGHIHSAQKLIRDTARYSGSPLKYSFSEVNHKKSVPIIEFKEKGKISIELVELVPLRDMRIIKGKLYELLDKNYVQNIATDDYISVVLTDEDCIMNAIGKLRSSYKNILKLEYSNMRTSNYLNGAREVVDVKKFNEVALFEKFYKMQNNIELNDERREIISCIVKKIKEDN